MKLAYAAAALLTVLILSGCVVQPEAGYDPHRQWWTDHHPQEAYDRDRAEREHRDYCGRTPDHSCEGWK
jgi:hypothetical protein